MQSRVSIDKEVNVTALYFRNKNQIRSFPKKMEYDGQEYTFVESGMRYEINKNNQLLNLFDMTDGDSAYRLKFDTNKLTWTLLSITQSLRV